MDELIATVGELRAAWGWLRLALYPARGPRPTPRLLSETAAARLARLGAAERADRIELLRHGRVPTGATTPGARVAALDARARIVDQLDDLAWLVASQMRAVGVDPYRPDGRDTDRRATRALDYLAAAAPALPVDVAGLALRDRARLVLDDCLRTARAVAGVGPARQALDAECPVCGRRSLAADTSSMDYREWAIRCTRAACRCDGRDCACGRPGRRPDDEHVWAQRSWESLAGLLERIDYLVDRAPA